MINLKNVCKGRQKLGLEICKYSFILKWSTIILENFGLKANGFFFLKNLEPEPTQKTSAPGGSGSATLMFYVCKKY